MRARFFLLAAALIAFGTSLGSGFHFDDYAIFSDPVLASARGAIDVWAPRQTRPLTYFTFWLNRQIGAGDPLGYHLFNLLLHLGVILLALECLRRLLPERAAWIATAIFAIAPIQSEAVDYIWARSILLATLLCLAALHEWLNGRPWIAVLWFALALLAKEECAAFPLFLAWLEWRKALPAPRRSKLALAAMLALSAAAGAHVIWALSVTPGAPGGAQAGITPLHYLLAQGVVIWRYLQLTLLPYGFTVDPDIQVAPWLGIAAWALLLAVVAMLLRRRATAPIATWFVAGLILLLPSSSIFPVADLSADRRMYLPLFAFAAAAAIPLARIRQTAVLAAIGVVLLAFSVQRTVVWMNDASLWQEALDRAPKKLRPKLQLARVLPAAKALDLLAKARLDAPYNPDIATETGKILLTEGQADGALEEFGRALALSPTDARNVNNRGVALQALGQTEAARADFERALRLDPKLTEARDNLAKLPARPQ
jgi:tetratricopeptide (TPR) repeat protein